MAESTKRMGLAVQLVIDETGTGLNDPLQRVFGLGSFAFPSPKAKEEALLAAKERALVAPRMKVPATRGARALRRAESLLEWARETKTLARVIFVRLDNPNVQAFFTDFNKIVVRSERAGLIVPLSAVSSVTNFVWMNLFILTICTHIGQPVIKRQPVFRVDVKADEKTLDRRSTRLRQQLLSENILGPTFAQTLVAVGVPRERIHVQQLSVSFGDEKEDLELQLAHGLCRAAAIALNPPGNPALLNKLMGTFGAESIADVGHHFHTSGSTSIALPR